MKTVSPCTLPFFTDTESPTHGSPTARTPVVTIHSAVASAAKHSRHPLLLRGEEEVELLAIVLHAEEEDASCVSLDNTAGERRGGRA